MDETIFELMKLRAKGFCCSQIILILALEAQGKTDKDLVRSMAGLCYGIEGAGEVCGALSGGACLISLYTAKGGDGEEVDHRYPLIVGELVDWFKASAGKYGGLRCDEILEKFPDRKICAQIVGNTYEKCIEILAHYGFDPAVGKGQ